MIMQNILLLLFGIFLKTISTANTGTVKSQHNNERRFYNGIDSGDLSELYYNTEYSQISSVLAGPIKCYSCVDCPKVTYNTTLKTCPMAVNNEIQTCITYAEKFRGTITNYIRGCTSELGTCSDLEQMYANMTILSLISCQQCQGNVCNVNGAASSYSSYIITFIAVIIFPVSLNKVL